MVIDLKTAQLLGLQTATFWLPSGFCEQRISGTSDFDTFGGKSTPSEMEEQTKQWYTADHVFYALVDHGAPKVRASKFNL